MTKMSKLIVTVFYENEDGSHVDELQREHIKDRLLEAANHLAAEGLLSPTNGPYVASYNVEIAV